MVLFSLPSVVVVATGLGGYASEKLIARDGVSDSQLIIGRTGVANSFLDIILGSAPVVPANPSQFDPTEPVASLIDLFVPILVITAIYGLARMALTGELTIMEMFLAFVFAYMLVGMLPGVQATVSSLFG